MSRLMALAAALALAGGGPCFAQSAPAPGLAQPDPERLAFATQIIDQFYPPQRRREMLSRMADTMDAQMRAALMDAIGNNMDEEGRAIFERYLDRSRAVTERMVGERSSPLFTAIARAYARHFTRDELLQIRAFGATPAGQRFFQQSSELMADPGVAEANTAYMRSIFSALEPLLAEMRQQASEYQRRRGRRSGS